VRQLVFGVVVDVLVHVFVELLQCHGVRQIAGAARDFVVLNAGQFVVLLPQIGLDDFGGSQEAQNGGIALGDRARCRLRSEIKGEQPARGHRSAGHTHAFEEYAPLENAVQWGVRSLVRRRSRVGQFSRDFILSCHTSPSDPSLKALLV